MMSKPVPPDTFAGKCGSCVFWIKRFYGRDIRPYDPGACHLRGPVTMIRVVLQSEDSASPVWPEVKAEDFCGEYEQRRDAVKHV